MRTLRCRWIILVLAVLLASCRADRVEVKPIRYRDVSVAMVFDGGQAAEAASRWLVEFAPSQTGQRVFLLPARGEAFGRYADVSASLIRDGHPPLPLRVELVATRRTGLDGERYTVTQPAVALPATQHNEWVEIAFRTAQRKHEAISWLPAGEVLRATIAVKSRGTLPRVASSGFASHGAITSEGWNIETLALAAGWGNAESRSAESAPYVVATTLLHWPQAWQAEAAAFRAELTKRLAFSDYALLSEHARHGRAHRTAAEKRKIAVDLYQWVVHAFAYRAAGLDPVYSTLPRPIEDTWKRKSGDCKDLALVYMKLLQEAGIEAEPVLVPLAGDRYLPRHSLVPTMLLFNHLIVYIPDLDQYVDVTAGPVDEFGALGAAYAHTAGGHMFSGAYRPITPGMPQSRVTVSTTIGQKDGKWGGTTVWNGAGMGQLSVRNAGDALRDRMNSDSNPRFLQSLGMTLVTGSWREGTRQGGRTDSFSFHMNAAPVDGQGRLAFLPRTFSAGNLLKYHELPGRANSAAFPCFSVEQSEELLVIEGVSAAGLDGIAEIHVQRRGLTFSQTVEVRDRTLRLVRHLDIDERRVVCSEHDAHERRAFFTDVRQAIDATEKQLDRRSL